MILGDDNLFRFSDDEQETYTNYILRSRERRSKRKRLLRTLSTLLIIIGSGLLVMLIAFQPSSDKPIEVYTIVIIIIPMILGLGIYMYNYLQKDTDVILNRGDSTVEDIRAEIQDLKIEFLSFRKKSGSSTENQDISFIINDTIANTITEDFINNKISSHYQEKAIAESNYKSILKDFSNLSYRINTELLRLRKSANLNLVLGTFVATSAMIALGYEVFNNELDLENIPKLLSHYLPRISVVIFIEVFAFFFLKLYKRTLEDIKYFSNEKTNIDFKLISLKTALQRDDKDLIDKIIEEFMKTERNFKLGNGESTVELEKIRNSTANNDIIAQLLAQLGKKS
ncbi:MAG: hypothetical protein ACI8ZM_002493 [Crocinitomix sp.]|jgi:hypothetical protein